MVPRAGGGRLLGGRAALLVGAVVTCVGCRPAHRTTGHPSGSAQAAPEVLAFLPSHKGDRAVVSWRASDALFLVEFRTRQETRITSLRHGPEGAWSPDDRLVALAAYRGRRKDYGVAVLDPATRRSWHLAPQSTTTLSPQWSPDGTTLVYEEVGRGSLDPFRVWEHTLQTGRRLVRAIGCIHRCDNPFWQQTLVFHTIADVPPTRHRFFARDSRGAQREILPHEVIAKVAASPDGSSLAALCRPETLPPGRPATAPVEYSVYLLRDAHAVAVRELCRGPLDAEGPLRWSAKSDRLLVAREIDPLPADGEEILAVDATSGGSAPLRDAKGQPIRGVQPYWADDDRSVLYLRRDRGHAGEVWCYTIHTKQSRRLYPFGRR